MKSRIRKMLMGNAVFSEYSKITVRDAIREKVYLSLDGSFIDISEDHWILCIEPIIFGVWIEKKDHPGSFGPGMQCQMYFSGEGGDDRKEVMKKAEAILTLEFFNRIEEEEGTLLLVKLRKSTIHQVNFIKTYLLYFRYYRRGGMTFSRFKSFVSAYSYPRRVRLVSFRQDDYFNIFPMDLLGDINRRQRYVFGLRHTNASLPRIMETRKLVVAEVSFKHKEIVYQLGKHHSGSPPSLDGLPFGVSLSKNYSCYIPDVVERYREIHILDTMNLGSHMLLWGESQEEQILTSPSEHLFIVHFLHFLKQETREPYVLA